MQNQQYTTPEVSRVMRDADQLLSRVGMPTYTQLADFVLLLNQKELLLVDGRGTQADDEFKVLAEQLVLLLSPYGDLAEVDYLDDLEALTADSLEICGPWQEVHQTI